LVICGAGMIAGDQDIGKGLVVAQQHIEVRPEALDEVGFEQQRFGLGRRRNEFHRGGRRDHAHGAVFEAGARIGQHALVDVLGLADIENAALAIEHAIDAGAARRETAKRRIASRPVSTFSALGSSGVSSPPSVQARQSPPIPRLALRRPASGSGAVSGSRFRFCSMAAS
jgi:hypothetical protein